MRTLNVDLSFLTDSSNFFFHLFLSFTQWINPLLCLNFFRISIYLSGLPLGPFCWPICFVVTLTPKLKHKRCLHPFYSTLSLEILLFTVSYYDINKFICVRINFQFINSWGVLYPTSNSEC